MTDAAIMPAKIGVPTWRRDICAAPCAITRGRRAEHESDRGHDHGPEPHAGAFDGRIDHRYAFGPALLGEFDDQDAVLGRQRDQHHEADLGVEIEHEAGHEDADEGAEHADRHRSSTGTGMSQLS